MEQQLGMKFQVFDLHLMEAMDRFPCWQLRSYSNQNEGKNTNQGLKQDYNRLLKFPTNLNKNGPSLFDTCDASAGIPNRFG